MNQLDSFKEKCNSISSDSFDDFAIQVFKFQSRYNKIYSSYIDKLSIDVPNITTVEEIPFLPIEFFKTQKVVTGNWLPQHQFLSSGTMSAERGKHEVEDVNFYLDHAKAAFESEFDSLSDTIVFALLPSYQEQGNSSLIRMVDHFMGISQSNSENIGGYYLNEFEDLMDVLQSALNLYRKSKKVILFGVGYALLDFAEFVNMSRQKLDGLTIIETGGMKGRRKEMVKVEYYQILTNALGDISICSEYGMTELLSQAYAHEDMKYSPSKLMKVLMRDLNDPFDLVEDGRVGGINVIDLANIHSCAFIETKDMGRLYGGGQFEIVGRIDNSDIRGCNLLVF